MSGVIGLTVYYNTRIFNLTPYVEKSEKKDKFSSLLLDEFATEVAYEFILEKDVKDIIFDRLLDDAQGYKKPNYSQKVNNK